MVFNKPIGSNQAIQFPLAQTKAKVEPAHIGTSMLGLPKNY